MLLNENGQTSLAKEKRYPMFLQGNGAAAMTVVFAPGVVVTRPAVGRVLITFKNAKDNPGTFLGATGGFRDATQANIKGFTMTGGVWDATNLAIELDIWNASQAAADLATTSFLDFELVFSALGTAKL